jgi:hypothetical protein
VISISETGKTLDPLDLKLAARRAVATLAAALAALTLAAGSAQAADPVIAAAGDIACDPDSSSFNHGVGTSTSCRQLYTSNLLVNSGFSKVLALGDNAYNGGTLSEYRGSYDPSWGRVKSITSPVLGNHENSGTGYYDYFNGAGARSGPGGERGKGYYSFDVGTWHLIALNSNCSRVSCSSGSTQERWLRADLDAHPNTCTLAYFHHARFSSGHDGNNTFMQTIWQDLYNAGAEIALSGHSHDYERFAPQNASGKLDRSRGVRQFVVGTGGAFFTGLSSAKANSEVRQNNTYGVLQLTLHPTSYDWKFVPESGKKFTDSGTGSCSGSGGITVPPAPAPLPVVPGTTSAPLARAVSVNPSTGAISSRRHAVRCTIVGTDGNDMLRGTPRRDVICGLGGNDRIRGRNGPDIVFGGDGKDRLAGGRGSDRLYGNRQRDVIRGQSGNDWLVGGGGRDRISGNAGSDWLLSAGDHRGGDHVSGGRGRDRARIDPADGVHFVERLLRGDR